MAAPATHQTGPVGPDTLITIKVVLDNQNRRFKLPLRDLGAHVLIPKLRTLLAIPPDVDVKFDRFSDSAGAYVTLDSEQPAIYKQLYRAAKAKLKLRLRATIMKPNKATVEGVVDEEAAPSVAKKAMSRSSYLETVLQPPPIKMAAPSLEPPVETARHQQVCSIPGAFSSNDSFIDPPPRPAPQSVQLSQPTLPSFHDFSTGTFTIDCNHCGESVPNEHFHCSICDKGDFDLCQACVDSGITCDGDGHWLIKRTIQNGLIMASVTDTCPRRKTQKTEVTTAQASPSNDEGERTCNCCINQLPSTNFVTCNDCPDFDLCMVCFQNNEHGHHPAHVFEPVDKREGMVSPKINLLCKAGRNEFHHAVCDGCTKRITGVRHKCLSCPDWDFCADCITSASSTHPGHRFAPIYGFIGFFPSRKETHPGIFCDGPLCAERQTRSYIKGDRYKCSICHDTDFCASCEAHPSNTHSKTHPLIKIQVPLRHVSIQTVYDHADGRASDHLGDRPQAKNASTETISNASTNTATQVQTMAECKPAEETVPTTPVIDAKKSMPADLQAWYESDSTPDGSDFGPNRMVSQSWTLRNPGPAAWPAGCAVYYIGGDDMRNLDSRHPSSVSTITAASRSDVLEHSLEPGKTAVFTVVLRSPAHEGRAISYWRLKTPDGTPFGHKLWVDINVKSTPIELPIRSAMPAVPIPTDADTSEKSSQMIFPKLEKESPASSIHQIDQTPTPVDNEAKLEEQDLWEGVESLDLEDESEDELLNEEEYDILDASDEDLVLDMPEAASKK
ncbi:hypothetical protein DV738_g1823, partial [Chaetothyriales sp. CBS 135597]